MKKLIIFIGLALLAAMLAPSTYAAKTDSNLIVGMLKFNSNVSKSKAIEIGEFLAKDQKAEVVYVRQTSADTWGIGVQWRYDSAKEAFQAVTDALKKKVADKYGKDLLDGWDLSSSVIWTKK
ncbi:MAG: hypothetical protein V1798_08200 [Pseudomonadota bacterium]